MNRREFLKSALLATVLSPLVRLSAAAAKEFEAGRGSRVAWARLKFRVTGVPGNALGWYYHPTGDVRMVEWLRKNTSINIKEEWNIVNVNNLEHMCQFPLIFLSGKGMIQLNAQEKNNVREYLRRGGFFFVDDCVALGQVKQDVFFTSVIKLLKEVLPEIEIKPVPIEHPVFHCYYDLNHWVHMQGEDNGLYGAWLDGRVVALLDSSDLHCGWAGFHFSDQQRAFAFKMAANIYVYAMEN